MTQLTGREASVLAFIARFPHSAEAANLAETLDGPAKKIAETLLGRRPTDVSSGAAAKAIKDWAAAS